MGSAKKKGIRFSKKSPRANRGTPRTIVGSEGGAPASQLPAPAQNNPWGALSLLAALIFVLGGLFSLPNYHVLLPPAGFLFRLLAHPSMLIIGFLWLFWLFRSLPEDSGNSETPRWQAYLWFCFFFALCFFSRFYHPEECSPLFWDDNLIETGDVRNMIDFKQYSLIFPSSSRPPFFYYFAALLWELHPTSSGVFNDRLTCTLVDLMAMWGFYRLGSAIRWRRMGLILMSLWAVSMPGTVWTYFDGWCVSAILAFVWILFFFFRLIQKPTLSHFVYWGMAMAFGDYCYPLSRSCTPTLITIVLLWIFYTAKEKPKNRAPWVLAGGLWLSWSLMFFYKNNFLPQNPLVAFALQPWFLAVIAAGLLAAYAKTWREAKPGDNNIEWNIFKWATGAGLTALIMTPLLLHPLYSAYSTTISIFHENGKLIMGFAALKLLWSKIVFTLASLFGTVEPDFIRFPVAGHSFFESFPVMATVIGLAYFLARPSWQRSVVLLIIPVELVPFILSNQDHTGRLLGAMIPLFLLGAWGLDVFWGIFSREMKNSVVRKGLFLLLLVYWGWDARESFALCREWMAYKQKNDAVIAGQVNEDWKPFRLIIAQDLPNFVQPPFPMLCDQKETWRLNNPHPIYLEPGQKGKDIVLLVSGGDTATLDRVRKDFPEAQWKDLSSQNGPGFMKRILIPFDSLSEVPGKLLFIQRVPHEYWRRQFYYAYRTYGIARGMIWGDDRVPSIQDSIPSFVNEGVTAQVDGQITISTDGEYAFSVSQAKDVTVLWIDGKKRMRVWPGQSAKENIHLKAGDHQVTLKTAFRYAFTFTDILVTPPGGGQQWILGKAHIENRP